MVADYYIGNARICIMDDYIVKTSEEKKEILDRIAKIALPYLRAQHFAEERSKEKAKEREKAE